MTTKQILRELRDAGKPVKLQQLYRYFLKFNIAPSGVRQRPQHYPPDSTAQILFGLGIVDRVEIPANGGAVKGLKAGKLITLDGKRRAVTTNTRSHLTSALTASRSAFGPGKGKSPTDGVLCSASVNGSQSGKVRAGTKIASMNQLRAERAKARGAK
jgi:hypothetical protein